MRIERASYQQDLARSLHEKNAALSEEIVQAFRVVPRHPFVDHYYLHERGSRLWTRQERSETDAWYERVYRDEALVTQVDQYGRTLSSSSQPTIMAAMLQALDVRPGMRVLEIGTGSGYNAAILAHLLGDPHAVTTLDLDPDLIQKARRTLPQVAGPDMTIVQANGTNGYEMNAPYDRILSTASALKVPQAWLDQLAPNGRLVGILQPPFAMLGGLLQADKIGEKLKGQVLQTASFMPLRSEEYHKRSIRLDFQAPTVTSFPLDALLFQPHLLRENHDFAFFLYADLPDLYLFQKEEAFFLYQEALPQGYVVLQQKPTLSVALHGDWTIACALWNRLVRAYSLWDRLGQPALAQYFFEMDRNGQALSLHTPLGTVWPFGIWPTPDEGGREV